MNNTIEKSVVMSLDGEDNDLFPYFPYILQDLWEIGTLPDSVINLVEKHTTNHSELKILDLGCGKGAVSVKLAQKFRCHCQGVDAIQEFIDEAKSKANEFNVSKLCRFECGDIRTRLEDFKDFDIVVLGAIGPVLGDYYATLTAVRKCLKPNGLIIIDDGYVDDNSQFYHPLIEKKSTILRQISEVGMELVDELIIDKDEITESDEYIYHNIKKRCQELSDIHPEKKALFDGYVRKQEQENDVLETKVICSVMVVGKGFLGQQTE